MPESIHLQGPMPQGVTGITPLTLRDVQRLENKLITLASLGVILFSSISFSSILIISLLSLNLFPAQFSRMAFFILRALSATFWEFIAPFKYTLASTILLTSNLRPSLGLPLSFFTAIIGCWIVHPLLRTSGEWLENAIYRCHTFVQDYIREPTLSLWQGLRHPWQTLNCWWQRQSEPSIEISSAPPVSSSLPPTVGILYAWQNQHSAEFSLGAPPSLDEALRSSPELRTYSPAP